MPGGVRGQDGGGVTGGAPGTVVGGVAARPLRLKGVEDSLRGERVNEETAELAGQTAIWGAKPLNHNQYKILLMKNLVKRAVRGAKA